MDLTKRIADTPVFVLCGGLGTRLREETAFRPKPMVPIGDRPILWHIMNCYSQFGFRKFILCLGYKGDQIKDYFLHYHAKQSDLTVQLAENSVETHCERNVEDWEVTLVDTGQTSMTGARLCRAAKYLGDSEHFAVTYGDGLCNAHLAKEFQFHLDHDRVGTVLGVNPPSRFGQLKTEGDAVLTFDEKPEFTEKWINGGYFFFRRSFISEYLTPREDCILEQYPLSQLARDEQLYIYRHRGFWACMDTQRDHDTLNELWNSGEAPWTVPVKYSVSCQAALHMETNNLRKQVI